MRRFAWAGCALGPAAWAISFQTAYALVPWQCARPAPVTLWISIGGILVALLGAGLSWRASSWTSGRTHRFVAQVGTGFGLLFALVMTLQAAASLIFHGCEV